MIIIETYQRKHLVKATCQDNFILRYLKTSKWEIVEKESFYKLFYKASINLLPKFDSTNFDSCSTPIVNIGVQILNDKANWI